MQRNTILSQASDPVTNKEYLANDQYNGTVHLQHRTKIFDYGDNVDLRQWEAEQYTGNFNLNNCETILEIGCGDGEFWKYMAPFIYSEPKVLLTDLSEAMLKACSSNLHSVVAHFPVSYEKADMDSLSFPPSQFDAVLAHNVIYHSSNPVASIESIKNTLKTTGFLGLSVLSQDVNKTVWKIANEINENVPDKSFTAIFSDKEADNILPLFFGSIEKHVYKNQFHFKESAPVVNMIKSSPIVQKLNLPIMFFKTLNNKIEEQISEKGEFVSEFNASLYLCKK